MGKSPKDTSRVQQWKQEFRRAIVLLYKPENEAQLMIEMESDRQALYQIAREHGDIDGLLAALRRLTEHQYRLAHFHGIRKGFEFGFLRGWRAARMLDKSKEKGASYSVR